MLTDELGEAIDVEQRGSPSDDQLSRNLNGRLVIGQRELVEQFGSVTVGPLTIIRPFSLW